jgi:hypothetical protein
VTAAEHLASLDPEQLRQTVLALRAQLAAKDELIERQARESAFKQALIDKLTHEMAVLRRLKFAAQSEAFNAEQKSLLEETIDADIAALEREIEQLGVGKKAPEDKDRPRRKPLPEHLPRTQIRHEPEDTICGCGCAMKRIGEDVAEKLDYQPRRLQRRAACARQVGLHALPEARAGAAGAAPHRQGAADPRTARAGAGREVLGSSAPVPPGTHLRAGRDGDRALDVGAVGGRMRRAAAAARGCSVSRAAWPRRAARR